MKHGIILFLALGCTPQGAKSPARELARAAAWGIGEGLHAADKVCGDVVRASKNEKLGVECSDAYAVARTSLIAVGNAWDAWEAADQGQIQCSISRAAEALSKMNSAMAKAGVDVPSVSVDGVKLAAMLGGKCS